MERLEEDLKSGAAERQNVSDGPSGQDAGFNVDGYQNILYINSH